jgi:hypothetical protein
MTFLSFSLGLSEARNGSRMKDRPSGVIWLLIALALVCVMPSKQSLWIDEGFTVPYAQEDSFARFMARLENEQGSEALMPLGMLSSWAGAKIFGRSELGLRAVSALWAGIAILLFWRTGLLVGIAWLPALLACHPFLWYYAGEVRPYAMVIAMSSGLLYGFATILSSERETSRGLHALLAFGLPLCATQVLGIVPFAVVAGVVSAVLLRRRSHDRGTFWLSWSLEGFSSFSDCTTQGRSPEALTSTGKDHGRLAWAISCFPPMSSSVLWDLALAVTNSGKAPSRVGLVVQFRTSSARPPLA